MVPLKDGRQDIAMINDNEAVVVDNVGVGWNLSFSNIIHCYSGYRSAFHFFTTVPFRRRRTEM